MQNLDRCDNVYYNINIPHDDNISRNGEPTPANYFEIRGTSILPCDAEDYTMSVVRFSIPTSQIPIQVVPVDISPGNTDINKLLYSITLEWNGNTFQEFITWETALNYAPVPNTPKEGQEPRYAPYYYLYSVKHLLYRINLALTKAFGKLVSAGAPITAPPFFEYTGETEKIRLYVPEDYTTNSVNVYANNALNRNFGLGFDQIYEGYNVPDGKDALFILSRSGTNILTLTAPINPLPLVAPYNWNTQPYIELIQDYNSVSDMSSFSSIVITSRSIPIRNEWVSLQLLKGPIPIGQPVPSNGTTQDGFLNILTDFEADIVSGFELRSKLIYTPTAEYRRTTLLGGNLSTIDIQVYWKDNYDNLYPVMIPAHDVLTIKLLFEKKL